MIDIENDVFNHVATILRNQFNGIMVSGEYEESFPKFPAVTIVEADNRVIQEMTSISEIEYAANLMYDVNVYSNLTAGRKSEAKAIANVIDEAFSGIGFTRTFREQIPNLQDATIYRITIRYEGSVDLPEGDDPDDQTYYIYRPY